VVGGLGARGGGLGGLFFFVSWEGGFGFCLGVFLWVGWGGVGLDGFFLGWWRGCWLLGGLGGVCGGVGGGCYGFFFL